MTAKIRKMSGTSPSKTTMPQKDVSQFLFTLPDGDSLKFLIRPSETKAKLRPLIEAGGGMITSKSDGMSDFIRIATESDVTTGQDYIHSSYIEDCVAQNSLLPMEDYKLENINQKSKTPETSPKKPSVSYIVYAVSPKKGRSKYTEAEDDEILKYVARHPSKLGGNAIWKKMELMRVTNHTWQSMKDRFLKYLHDRLPEFLELERQKQPPSEDLFTRFRRLKDALHNKSDEDSGDTQGVLEFLRGLAGKDDEDDDNDEDVGIDELVEAEKNDGDEDHDICTLSRWLLNTSKRFNLTPKAILAALYLNSGDIETTEYLLMHNRLHEDACIWTREDDQLLCDSNFSQYQELCERYGLENVKKRQKFLLGSVSSSGESEALNEEPMDAD